MLQSYDVTIVLITGYEFDNVSGSYDLDRPKLKYVDFTVQAETEEQAISLAKAEETSSHSIWESYANLS